ncbi:MAG: ABC transporter substrate-binding protein [SAR324 cluster bacterium]|nr:ABC transporter substrate-binding protein [SAR324 cluster bacterium]
MKKNFLIIGVSLLFLFFANSAWGAKPKIAWFWSSPSSGFWPMVERFISAASEDLGVDLDAYSYGENHTAIVPLVKQVLSNPSTKPDAVLIHNFKTRGKDVLELCEQYKVPILVFNAGFSEAEGVGKPREKYKYWIGLMLPDDEYAGYILAKRLIEEAKKLNKRGNGGEIQIVALEGNRASEASNSRVRGLKKAMAHSEFKIQQFFHSKWKEHLAQEAFELSSLRYLEVSLYWAASDSMAIGVVKAAEKRGLIPGKDFVVGGIDLLPENQEYLKSGKLAVSVGGHYAEGAWAIILLYDYLKGYDFAPFESSFFSTKMGDHQSSTFAELGDLRQKLSAENIRKINFKQFSKAYNPDLKKYNF